MCNPAVPPGLEGSPLPLDGCDSVSSQVHMLLAAGKSQTLN